MKADKIYYSDAVFTGDGRMPFSGGVAVVGKRIAAVGTRAQLEPFVGPDTERRDFGASLLMPGFCDAHVHFAFGAFYNSKYYINEILNSKSETECVGMVKAFAEAHPDYKRIVGQGWFPANWNDAPLPTKASLDAAVPDRPVYLSAADSHTGWLNSLALAECGADPDDPVLGPNIGRLPNGEMSGILSEDAWFALAADKVTQPGPDVDEEVERALLKALAQSGITTVCDMSGILQGVNYDAMERIERAGALTARVFLNPAISPDEEQRELLSLYERFHSDKLCVAGAKGVVDGVTSTFTGFLLEPYADRPDTCGAPLHDREYFEKSIIEANRHGFGVRLHCIADGSVRLALDCFEKSNAVNGGNKGIRNAVEHIENIHPDDIPRFHELGVVASMQPRHLPLDANEKLSRVGPERSKWEWPNRSILDTGGVLAFGTDYPVVDYNPFETIYYAVTRNGYDHQPTGVNPWERVTLAETLKAYTWGGAYAAGKDGAFGTLAPGLFADLVVLDRDLFKTPVEQIPETEVLLTLFDGEAVYEKA